jgi:hypothetical protein
MSKDTWSEATGKISNDDELYAAYRENLLKFSPDGNFIDQKGIDTAHMATTIVETAGRLKWTNKKFLRVTLEAVLRMQNPKERPLK